MSFVNFNKEEVIGLDSINYKNEGAVSALGMDSFNRSIEACCCNLNNLVAGKSLSNNSFTINPEVCNNFKSGLRHLRRLDLKIHF